MSAPKYRTGTVLQTRITIDRSADDLPSVTWTASASLWRDGWLVDLYRNGHMWAQDLDWDSVKKSIGCGYPHEAVKAARALRNNKPIVQVAA